jgi:hypothetical protein
LGTQYGAGVFLVAPVSKFTISIIIPFFIKGSKLLRMNIGHTVWCECLMQAYVHQSPSLSLCYFSIPIFHHKGSEFSKSMAINYDH